MLHDVCIMVDLSDDWQDLVSFPTEFVHSDKYHDWTLIGRFLDANWTLFGRFLDANWTLFGR